MSLIRYARVSTREDRQHEALRTARCARIFEDRTNGIKAEQPGLTACLGFSPGL